MGASCEFIVIVLRLCFPRHGNHHMLLQKKSFHGIMLHNVDADYIDIWRLFQYNMELAKEVISITTTSSFHGLDLDCGCESGNGGGGRDGK